MAAGPIVVFQLPASGIWALRGDPRRSDIVRDLGVCTRFQLLSVSPVTLEVTVDLLVRSLQSKVADLAKELQGLKDSYVLECGLFPFCFAFQVIKRYMVQMHGEMG